jgi:[acyl-carrier-protein] S-malonyltransferase
VPVWSNVDARPHTDPAEVRGLLVRQVVQPVLWEGTLRGLLETGCDRFYEIGPQRVLAGLLKRVQRKAECVNVGA